MRSSKFTNRYKLRSYVPSGKQCWFATVDSIKTQYGGDLNFDFRFNNYQAKAKCYDIAKWTPEM